MSVGRFAPSTTGPAHPGTLLAALLCWLDARSRGARVVLRLEDLDPQRCRPQWARAMRDDLEWLGLDFDASTLQSAERAGHEEALDRLAAEGRLYPCGCTRRDLRASGVATPDGGFRYPNACRARPLPPGGWRSAREPIRLRLEAGLVVPHDEGGLDLADAPAESFGDPVVVRRDGAPSYHLASVVDDARAGVTRVVRGRDLAPAAALQRAIGRALGLPEPVYRHHLLLLEERGGKLAKLHGAVGARELRRHYRAEELCGFLAAAAGLADAPEPVTPGALRARFSWERVGTADRVVRWEEPRLHVVGSGP